MIGSANISEAELETIDGITAGTVVASKALVVDSNKDIGTIRNLTIDGVFTDGNYTFDTNGNVSGLGTVGCGAITSSGSGNFYNVLETTGGNAFFKSKTSTGEFGIGTNANDFAIYSYDDSEYRMWITDTGDVGFGTTSPQEKLHIYGSGTTRVEVESGGTHAYFKTSSSSRGYGIGTSSTSFKIYDYNAAAARVCITSAGDMGLGTDTPGAKLDVVGDISATGAITGGSLLIGSANISEAELETIDGITAGTAAASKALVLDSNKDIGTIRNLTIDGVFTDGNYTFDTNGNVSGLGTVGCGTITTIGDISCSNTLTSKTIVPPLVAYTVISGNANSLLNDFLYVKNRLCISSHTAMASVTNAGNLGYFPDIYGDSSKLTHSDTGSKQSVGIIDTDIFDLSHCVNGNSVNGGNTSNVYTGANARWGIKVKIGGLYSIKYTVNIENEVYGDRLSILTTPRFTISDSGGTEYYMDILQARATEYTRHDDYGQYCCLTGMGTFSIPNASANHANGAWLKINIICGKATSEIFDDHAGGLKVQNMSIKMKRLGDHVGG